jgi:hypothetical protein
MNQKTLFDVGPAEHKRTRDVDPDTSHMAAAQVARKSRALHDAMIDSLRLSGHAMTAQEMAADCQLRCGGLAESYRKRCHELVNEGLIKQCGVRVCAITGASANTYRRV